MALSDFEQVNLARINEAFPKKDAPVIKKRIPQPVEDLYEQLSDVLADLDEHFRDFNAHEWWTTVRYEPTPWSEDEPREFDDTTPEPNANLAAAAARLSADRCAPDDGDPCCGAVEAEVRITSDTGGAKGSKLARYDQIPTYPLHCLAEHYGAGNAKYPSIDGDNWRKGYPWSLSYAALQRHANAFWSGEDIDAETGHAHLTAVAWHAFALLDWSRFPELVERFDDRQNT